MNQIPPDLEKKLRRFAEAGLTVITNPAELTALKPKGEQEGEQEGEAGAEPYDPWEVLTPLRFPVELLPPELRRLTTVAAESIGCDPAAIGMSGLAALAAAIDGSSRLKMRAHSLWAVPPALWIALIGPSSARKSPAISEAWRPIWRRQGVAFRQHKAQAAAVAARNQDKPKGEREPLPEPPARLVTADTTCEALQNILSSQSRGIAMLRDELAGFIGSLEKYSSGRGPLADRAFYLQAFDGGDFTVDRIGRGTLHIENLLVTICGGIQPERLREIGNLTSDGLWQRFIPVIVGAPSLGTDAPTYGAYDDYEALINHLIDQPPMFPTLSSEARNEFELVHRNLFDLQKDELLGQAFSSFVGKLDGYWGRLVLVLHAATRPPEGGGVVSLETAQRATKLIFKYILPSAAQVYAALGGGTGDADAVRDVAGFILAKQKRRIVASDLTTNVRRARGMSLEEVQRLVSPLVAGGWLEPELELRTNNAWTVNPQVHQVFAERAAEERKRREAIRRLICGGSETEA